MRKILLFLASITLVLFSLFFTAPLQQIYAANCTLTTDQYNSHQYRGTCSGNAYCQVSSTSSSGFTGTCSPATNTKKVWGDSCTAESDCQNSHCTNNTCVPKVCTPGKPLYQNCPNGFTCNTTANSGNGACVPLQNTQLGTSAGQGQLGKECAILTNTQLATFASYQCSGSGLTCVKDESNPDNTNGYSDDILAGWYGYCRQSCDYGDPHDPQYPITNGGCSNNSSCHILDTVGENDEQVGYCISADQSTSLNEQCTIPNPNDNQGTCIHGQGLICNMDAASANNGKGTCLPSSGAYTCDSSRDTRTGVKDIGACTTGFTCSETRGKVYHQLMGAGNVPVPSSQGGTGCLPAGTSLTATANHQGFPSGVDKSCNYECLPTANVNVTCTCFSPGDASTSNGSSKGNGFKCSNTTGQTAVQACSSTDYACYNTNDVITGTYDGLSSDAYQTLRNTFGDLLITGIKCETLDQHAGTLPVPPAPPCVTLGSDGACNEVLTTFGNVSTDPAGFITRFFGIVLGAAGSIALILFMRAGYRIMTSRGNPEGIKEGREQIVAAIIGLMFLVFSFVILQVIGVDLLRLPTGGAIPLGGTCDVNNSKCANGLVCNYNGAQGQCQRPI